MGSRIVVGMSGGVDSTVTLLLLKEQGWDPVGVTLRLPSHCPAENACCTEDTRIRAKKICDSLGVPHVVLDTSESFDNTIVDYFLSELSSDRTPNPCVMCNRFFKYKELFDYANSEGISYVATGHYARLVEGNDGIELHRAKDSNKDQTYGLALLPRSWLSYIRLPLGDVTKDEVYRIAASYGFSEYETTKQSQDLCFVTKEHMGSFLSSRLGDASGRIIGEDGSVLGSHDGSYLFTIGQKKGLGLPGSYFVRAKQDRNVFVVSSRDSLYEHDRLILSPSNVLCDLPADGLRITAKLRYRCEEESVGTLFRDGEQLVVQFDKKQYAVTPGQFCILYQDSRCIGGGGINLFHE